MTEREAIEELKHSIVSYEVHNRNNITCDLTREVLNMAINAMEKQIAKKPHKNFEKFSGVWCSCGKYLGKGYFVDKPSYCPDCGQKLDWS